MMMEEVTHPMEGDHQDTEATRELNMSNIVRYTSITDQPEMASSIIMMKVNG